MRGRVGEIRPTSLDLRVFVDDDGSGRISWLGIGEVVTACGGSLGGSVMTL